MTFKCLSRQPCQLNLDLQRASAFQHFGDTFDPPDPNMTNMDYSFIDIVQSPATEFTNIRKDMRLFIMLGICLYQLTFPVSQELVLVFIPKPLSRLECSDITRFYETSRNHKKRCSYGLISDAILWILRMSNKAPFGSVTSDGLGLLLTMIRKDLRDLNKHCQLRCKGVLNATEMAFAVCSLLLQRDQNKDSTDFG